MATYYSEEHEWLSVGWGQVAGHLLEEMFGFV